MNEKIVDIFNRYLSKTATEDEIAEFNEWISSNEELKKWLENQMQKTSDEIDEKTKARIFEKIQNEINKQEKVQFSLPKWLRNVAAIAVIALTVVGLISVLSNRQSAEMQFAEVGALRGQKASVTLPDGTHVILNSESTIKYSTAFNKSDRQIELTGEAYFDVAKDKKRAFVVKAGNVEVVAVGTAFNVKAYPGENQISTTLLEGKVNVSKGKETVSMQPNEKLEFNVKNNSFNKFKLTEAENSIGWMNDKLSFDNATLEEVVAVFSRFYNVEIQFATEAIKKQRFTGQINNNSLPSVLRILSLTSPIRFEHKDSVVVLYEVPAENKLFQQSK